METGGLLYCFICFGVLLISGIPALISGEAGEWFLFFWVANFIFITVVSILLFISFDHFGINFGFKSVTQNDRWVAENWMIFFSIAISTLASVIGMLMLKKKRFKLPKLEMHKPYDSSPRP